MLKENHQGRDVLRDVLMMWVSAGITAGQMAWRRWDGVGSSGQVVGWLKIMSSEISASESEEKDVNECMFAGKMCLTDPAVENYALMVWHNLNFINKNVAKSSTVRVDQEGGERRREENVLKCMQKLDELLFLLWYYVILTVEALSEKEERSDWYTLRSVGFLICARPFRQPWA